MQARVQFGAPLSAAEIAVAAKALPVTIDTLRTLVQMAAAVALSLDAAGEVACVEQVSDALVVANEKCDLLFAYSESDFYREAMEWADEWNFEDRREAGRA